MISTSFGLIATTIYSFGLSFFDNIYLSMFFPPILLLLIQKDAIFVTFKKLIFLNIFIIFVSASALLNKDYELALLIFLRSNALLLFMLLIFYKKNLFDIAISLQTLKFPDKFTSIFFFVAKFIVIMKEEFEVTKKVMKTRNFRAKSNIFSYKIYSNVIGMIIVKCFDKADKLKNSMILRNFQGKIYQSKTDKFSKTDFLIFCVIIFSLTIKYAKVSL